MTERPNSPWDSTTPWGSDQGPSAAPPPMAPAPPQMPPPPMAPPVPPYQEPEPPPGSVRVTLAGSGQSDPPRWGRILAIVLAAVVASAGVLLGVRLLGDDAPSGPAGDPLDANRATAGPQGTQPAGPAPIEGTARLVTVGPKLVVDTRTTGPLAAGGEVDVPLSGLPSGTNAVSLEVSLVQATGPGTVTLDPGTGPVTVLRVPRAGAQTTTTTVARVGREGQLRARTEGGGHLVVNLIGAFEPVQDSTSGRVVPVPATQVLRLVPEGENKSGTIDITAVPAVREAGTVSAVYLQFSADVGRNGGNVSVGRSPDRLDQQLFWSATTGEDRTRGGFMLVPVTGGPIHVQYQAGAVLNVDLVGFVTGDTAQRSTSGLVVPVAAPPGQPSTVAAGATADVPVAPGAVPADRVAGAFVAVAATGDVVGAVSVFAPDSPPPGTAILSAGGGAARATLTLVRTVNGTVRVATASGASVTVTPQAVVLR